MDGHAKRTLNGRQSPRPSRRKPWEHRGLSAPCKAGIKLGLQQRGLPLYLGNVIMSTPSIGLGWRGNFPKLRLSVEAQGWTDHPQGSPAIFPRQALGAGMVVIEPMAKAAWEHQRTVYAKLTIGDDAPELPNWGEADEGLRATWRQFIIDGVAAPNGAFERRDVEAMAKYAYAAKCERNRHVLLSDGKPLELPWGQENEGLREEWRGMMRVALEASG